MKTVKNIIFDFGGVIIDIDFPAMQARFESFGVPFDVLVQTKIYSNDFECGKVSKDEVYEDFRKVTGKNLTDKEIQDAWNLVITNFNPQRMALLDKLSKNHKIYLFSNTNEIHTEYFEKLCKKQMGRSLSSYFTRIFYSQVIGWRKPHSQAFYEVLQEAEIDPSKTLFMDDLSENIIGARKVGLNVRHLDLTQETILEIDWEKY